MTRRIGLATTIAAVAILTLALLALAPAGAQAGSASVSITGGNTLQVVGDDTANDISVESGFNAACPGGGRCFWFQSETSVMIASAPCVVREVPGKGHQAVCSSEGLNVVAMFGRGGRDTLDGVTKFLTANLHGDSGNDRLIAGYGNATLFGGPGSDDLIGGPGNDLLMGQAGNDGMDGRKGHDRCIGGPGRDTPRRCERVKSVP
jgi:Ca2+-binding RTX toxin-like protein